MPPKPANPTPNPGLQFPTHLPTLTSHSNHKPAQPVSWAGMRIHPLHNINLAHEVLGLHERYTDAQDGVLFSPEAHVAE
jgi:hypothetical protein